MGLVITKINNYAGILTVLTFVGALIFHFAWLEASVDNIQLVQSRNIMLVRAINSNVEKEIIYRQHLATLVSQSSEQTKQMNILLNRLSVTLDNIDRKLK